MTLLPPPDRWTIELANAQRLEAIAAFGFTERQARFLLNVLLHSGVFVERQYCAFAGIVHGQKSTDFIASLDKLPIGMQPYGEPHVFVYLVTHPSPMDFRMFLLRHSALLRVLLRWTVRLLLPLQLSKARLSHLHAAREHLATPLEPSTVETLEWLFVERKRLAPRVSAGGAKRGPLSGLSAAVSRHQPALARPEARVCLQTGGARRPARPGSGTCSAMRRS